jgi:UDP-glucuronate 4-epimerase
MKTIVITGVAGFVGFHLAKALLKKKIRVIGIDNINNYYSIKLKKKRLLFLEKYKNFNFYKVDLRNLIALEKIIENKNIYQIYHFAAQAGVRYSISNPSKYLNSNIISFFNILEICKMFKIKKLIYASSSSVYGDSDYFPLRETQLLKPKNFYAMTKKNNEEMADIYSKFYNINIIGLRLFSIYGEWGRPDMFIFKMIDSFYRKKIFYLYNYGDHVRDFTYISDAVSIILKINFPKKISHNIFNICSSKAIEIKKVIQIITNLIGVPMIKKVNFQEADVYKTFGSNKKILKFTKFNKFTKIEKGIKNVVNWYKNYYKKL